MKRLPFDRRICWAVRRSVFAVVLLCLLFAAQPTPGEDGEKKDDADAVVLDDFTLVGGWMKGILLNEQERGLAVAYLRLRKSGATERDYQASIDWGDESGTTRGQVIARNDTFFEVAGRHVYAAAGKYTVSTAVTGPDGRTQTTTSWIDVGHFYAGRRDNWTAASFPIAHPAEASQDVRVSIDWGDGTPAAPGTAVRAGGLFRVQGSHAYPANGRYTVRTLATRDGVVLSRTSQLVRVVPPPIRSKVLNSGYLVNQPKINVVKLEFSVDNPFANREDFGVMIDWGDGTPLERDAPIVGSGGNFRVVVTHTYKEGKSYNFWIVIQQNWH